MKKVYRKIFIMLICVLLVFSSACSSGSSPSTDDGNKETVLYTNEYIVDNGKSDYKIVLPDNPHGYESYSASELAKHIKEAANVNLEVIAESEVVFSENSKLLIVGETKISKDNGVEATLSVYGTRGFIVRTIGSSVFMVGGDTKGTLFAVYEFLHHQFGYEPYYMDVYKIDKGVFQRKLIDFKLDEIPDIAYACGTGEFLDPTNNLEALKLRYSEYNDIFVNTSSVPWHNTFYLIEPDVYLESHPKWFTQGVKQLHYTCYGDDTELKLLQDTVLEKLIAAIEKDFANGDFYEMIGFMQQDENGNWANTDEPYLWADKEQTINYPGHTIPGVDSCQALKDKYGASYAAAMLIQFINPVAKRLQEYMDENWNGRNMYITIFAYHDTESAPTTVVGGKDVPIDDSVVLEDNVCVMLAPIFNDFTKDYEETGLDIILNRWKAISSNIALWFYDYYFDPNFFYFDSLYSTQRLYQLCKDAGAMYIFSESTFQISPFFILRQYIQGKLMWDTDADVDALVDGFFENYYLDSAPIMRSYFELLRTHVALKLSTGEMKGGCHNTAISTKTLWPEGLLSQCEELMNQALATIEYLKNEDSALYLSLRKRILIDTFSIRYSLLSFYANEHFSESEFYAEVDSFVSDLKSVGINTLDRKSVDQLGFSRA